MASALLRTAAEAHMTSTHTALAAVAFAAFLGGGCGASDTEVDSGDEAVGEQEAPIITNFGTIYQGGTKVTFARIVSPTGINMSQAVGLTACGPKTLYATTGSGTYSLWFSNDSGQTWTQQPATFSSPEIACDHTLLFRLDSLKRLWAAPINSNGSLGTFVQMTPQGFFPTVVDRIQGGDGTIYGVKINANGSNQLYLASSRSRGMPASGSLGWGNSVATIGSTMVTGTGTTSTGNNVTVSVSPNPPAGAVRGALAWPRRAFTVEPNNTVYSNTGILAGSNSWTSFNTGSERYTTLTAAAPNVLYGLQTKPGGVVELNRITIEESSCWDGIDNDSNGLTDGEDELACSQEIADGWCPWLGDGEFCQDRFQPSTFLDQPNQANSIVKCTGGVGEVKYGVCAHSGQNNDYRVPLSSPVLTPLDPPGTGRWCNVHWPDGTWDFDWSSVPDADPCDTLLTQSGKPGGWVVRAGLYSISGLNSAYVACTDGAPGPSSANGELPLETLYDVVTHGANRCLFTVSPDALPLFSRMFDPAHLVVPVTRPFVHNFAGTPIDRLNQQVPSANETAYDIQLDEGRPLVAVSGGVVLQGGSRDRDLTSLVLPGTSANQGEIYVKHTFGSHPTYQETFVVYYAHVRKRLVRPSQTVKKGQILGYVGESGAAGGDAHLHVGVFRLSNINAHTNPPPPPPAQDPGYHANFLPVLTTVDSSGNNMSSTNAIDPLGWGASGVIDPYGYVARNQVFSASWPYIGNGAWSIALFKSGEGFTYP